MCSATRTTWRRSSRRSRYRDEDEALRRIGSRIGGYREQYHRGYWRDDVGRYAPANELVQELHRRVEEVYGAVR